MIRRHNPVVIPTYAVNIEFTRVNECEREADERRRAEGALERGGRLLELVQASSPEHPVSRGPYG